MNLYTPIDTKQALSDLIDSNADKTLKLLSDKGALDAPASGDTLPTRHGTAVRGNQTVGSKITSPLVEVPESEEYYDDMLYVDSSGLLCFIIKPVKKKSYDSSDNPPIRLTFENAPPPPIP